MVTINMNDTGSIFYQDGYDQLYKVDWTIINNVMDITTIVMQPFVYGQQEGYIQANTIFRKGIITVKHQVFKLLTGGYVLQAEGLSSYVDYIQMTYPCGGGPVDNFKYHVDNQTGDDFAIKVVDGPHWADPDDPDDLYAVWGDVNNDGSIIDITATGGVDVLEWIDIW